MRESTKQSWEDDCNGRAINDCISQDPSSRSTNYCMKSTEWHTLCDIESPNNNPSATELIGELTRAGVILEGSDSISEVRHGTSSRYIVLVTQLKSLKETGHGDVLTGRR